HLIIFSISTSGLPNGDLGFFFLFMPFTMLIAFMVSTCWIMIASPLIKELFSVEIFISSNQILLRRKLPFPLNVASLVVNDTARFRSDSVWWDFSGGKIVASDGATAFWVNPQSVIRGEALVLFQEQLESKLNANNIRFQVGNPPRVRF